MDRLPSILPRYAAGHTQYQERPETGPKASIKKFTVADPSILRRLRTVRRLRTARREEAVIT